MMGLIRKMCETVLCSYEYDNETSVSIREKIP